MKAKRASYAIFLEMDQVKDFMEGIVYPCHKFRGYSGERASNKAAIVNGSKLIHNNIRVAGQVARTIDTDAERLCPFNKVCREWNNKSGGMIGVEKRLGLDDQYRPGFAGFGATAGVKVCKPDFAAIKHPNLPRSFRNRR
jgi:hypothetical protein